MAMRRSSRVVSISEYVRTTALNVGVKDVTVIYNLAPMKDGGSANQARDPVKPRKANILYVGTVAEHKGLVPLVNAFARLAADYPELHLDIVGGSRYDTEFRALLMQLIESNRLAERVKLHGHVDDPSIFYQRAELHVAPSLCEEALGNVVLEAKREGTPSVVFPSGGLSEMVRHQVDGYICREKSVDALAEGLRWMLDDPDRLQQTGEAALEDSEARFGRERFARAWADVYRSVT
jgi:glycosyltransferase involved in cell wall biosynthesis